MALKIYGHIHFIGKKGWEISRCEPHVSIALKAIFRGINKPAHPPYVLEFSDEMSHDLQWFLIRYPMEISSADKRRMSKSSSGYTCRINEVEQILNAEYKPSPVSLNPGMQARGYQLIVPEVLLRVDRLLLADDMGLGKTLSAILCMLVRGQFPVAVVVQAHLPMQWHREIHKYSNMRVHIIKKTKPYSLPPADVYIFSYSKLAGWTTIFAQNFFQGAVFDECQELRICGSDKYSGAEALSRHVKWALGMSGTPIYNYGGEIYWVTNAIKAEALGEYGSFIREWTDGGQKPKVRDPEALGTYLREKTIMLRRTREDVGRELPKINKLIYNVGYREDIAHKAESLAYQLAIKSTMGSFMERGQAARELDALARHTTGVAKAYGVAEFVKILLENDRHVLLGGWHREVYEIWAAELAEYEPVFYTGAESPSAKNAAIQKFTSGETKLLIMSVRSGIGVDGLQDICYTVVNGELDWSPKVHDQFNARVDRDGQKCQVEVYYTVVDEGSDPVVMDVLGLKASQSHGIVDPGLFPTQQLSDDSNMQKLAQHYLEKRKHRAQKSIAYASENA